MPRSRPPFALLRNAAAHKQPLHPPTTPSGMGSGRKNVHVLIFVFHLRCSFTCNAVNRRLPPHRRLVSNTEHPHPQARQHPKTLLRFDRLVTLCGGRFFSTLPDKFSVLLLCRGANAQTPAPVCTPAPHSTWTCRNASSITLRGVA